MAKSKIPVIVLRGTAFERGQQHAAHLRSLIVANYDHLRRTADADVWKCASAKAVASLEKASALDPDLSSELEGMAAETGISTVDMYLLSCFEYFSQRTTGCTSAAVSTPSGALVAQNWDGPEGAERHLAVLVHESPGKRMVTIATAGTLGWVGLNDSGFAFVNNDLMLDEKHDSLPSLVIRRLMLARPSVEAALSVLMCQHHMSGRSFILGDAAGRLQLAEVGPSVGVSRHIVGSVVHTNHPLFPDASIWEDIEAGARHYPSSRERLRAARLHTLTDAASLSALLHDRTGAPDAIFKSFSTREQTATAFSVIFDCGQRKLTIWSGQPDEASPQHIGLLA
ncbi:C45 family autoproteolytic acyltransferase/hydolase [Rhizobium grahamii]|uniref:Acyl-CoA-6-aminopenicillanic acid acyltransferase n=1 Tax=Rhizobium grahamii CCGE 502 TaxID=990285 RepID=S3HV31_9HYPH|nr:C45 family peptidase [Rhizobium grahamii]EPE97041.1 acyl-CoA-6-aminopenicillanic acid acyltransferase [Rhizobium grahamii CCGE 502]